MTTPAHDDLSKLPHLLTVAEAAEFLRMTTHQVYYACSRGRLPSVKLGERLYIPRAPLLRLLGIEATPSLAVTTVPPTVTRPARRPPRASRWTLRSLAGRATPVATPPSPGGGPNRPGTGGAGRPGTRTTGR